MPIAFSLIGSGQWQFIPAVLCQPITLVMLDNNRMHFYCLVALPYPQNEFKCFCNILRVWQHTKFAKINSHVSFFVISSPNPDLNTHNIKFCKSLFYWTANWYVLFILFPVIQLGAKMDNLISPPIPDIKIKKKCHFLKKGMQVVSTVPGIQNRQKKNM